MKEKAIILTNGLLTTSDAKTAHGLIRGTERYTIVGVIDAPNCGKDAGEILDGIHRDIPVFSTVAQAISWCADIRYMIIGVATVGGVLPDDMLPVIRECLQQGISIVNGLHDYLNEKPELVALAQQHNATLVDIRKPKARKDLHFWTGKIGKVPVPIIAVMGMDCAMGKRTTCRLLREACEQAGLLAQMIYTGQTGWLQGGKYGFIFDSTLNDFISGELEHAIVSCWEETQADVILLEGQSALRNPSGPCGLEFLISGNARHVVLVHAPKRLYYDHDVAWGKIPPVESEIEIIKKFGSQVIAVALNTEGCTPEEAYQYQQQYSQQLHIPVLLPLQEGVDSLVPVIQSLCKTPSLKS
jgi:uncharacterized NAD-dependent epimerase/dehydratase family protein